MRENRLNSLQQIHKQLKARKSRSRWHRLVTGMACVVVFCTVYALILPAVTQTTLPQPDGEQSEVLAAFANYFVEAEEQDAYLQWHNQNNPEQPLDEDTDCDTQFVWDAMSYAGTGTDFLSEGETAAQWQENAIEQSDAYGKVGEVEPMVGDLAFAETDEETVTVGIVTAVTYDEEDALTELTVVRAVGMGSDIQIVAETYQPDEEGALIGEEAALTGFVRLPEREEPAEEEMEESFTEEDMEAVADEVPPEEFEQLDGEMLNPMDAVAYVVEEPAENVKVSFFKALRIALLSEIDPEPLKLENYIRTAVIRWRQNSTDEWQAMPTDGSTIPADANLRVDISYSKVSPESLKNAGYQLVYQNNNNNVLTMGDSHGGVIRVGNIVRGTVEAQDQKLILTFDEDWIDDLVTANSGAGENNRKTVTGTCSFEASLNLDELEGGNNRVLNLGSVQINLPVEENALAKYGELNLKKEGTGALGQDGKKKPKLAHDDENGYWYLEYTLTADTGKYGMKEVKVEDTLSNTGDYLLGYVSGSFTETVSVNGGTPTHGSASVSISGDNKSLTWNIDDMGANEERVLTYRVKVKDSYVDIAHVGNNNIANAGSIKNEAQISSKNIPHELERTEYTANATGSIRKDTVKMYQKEGEENYWYVDYLITVSVPATNDYTLTNMKVYDHLENNNYKQYIEYLPDSFQLLESNGATPYTPAAGESATNLLLTQPTTSTVGKFDYFIGDMHPGDVRKIKYTARIDSVSAMGSANGAVGIFNTAELRDNPEKTGGNQMLHSDYERNQVGFNQWSRKLSGGTLARPATETIPAGATVFDATTGAALSTTGKTLAAAQNVSLPAGAVQYTVVVNEKGEWDVSGAAMTDNLGNTKLEFTGYVRVDAYPRVTDSQLTGNDQAIIEYLKTRTPEKSVWVKVDKLSSFNLSGDDMGLDDSYAYVLSYYAKAKDSASGFGTITFDNNFSMSGKVVDPGGTQITLSGITATKRMSYKEQGAVTPVKLPWYYDPYDTSFAGNAGLTGNDKDSGGYPLAYQENGALYWAIEFDGGKFSTGYGIQDSTDQSGHTSGIRPGSLVGFYMIEMDADESLPEVYGDVEEFLAAVDASQHSVPGARDIQIIDKETTYTGGAGASKWGAQPSEKGVVQLVVTNKTTYRGAWVVEARFTKDLSIPAGYKAYLIVRTEPTVVPGTGESIMYQNRSGYMFSGASDYTFQTPVALPASGPGGSLKKSYGGVYDVKNNQPVQRRETSDIKEFTLRTDVVVDASPWADGSRSDWTSAPTVTYKDGTYVAWNLKVNGGASMSGAYTITDTLPEGVELVYVRPLDNRFLMDLDRWKDSRNNTGLSLLERQRIRKDIVDTYLDAPGTTVNNATAITDVLNLGSNGTYNDSKGWRWTFGSPKAELVDDGWTEHVTASRMTGYAIAYTNVANAANYSAAWYYTKDNQIKIWLPKLVKGYVNPSVGYPDPNHIYYDKYITPSIEYQVVCRVTDPAVYYEDVEFVNTADVVDKMGKTVDVTAGTITVRNNSLTKTDLTNLANGLTSAEFPYEIVLNDEKVDMDPIGNAISVPLVDSMTDNLAIRMDTLRIYIDEESEYNLAYSGQSEQQEMWGKKYTTGKWADNTDYTVLYQAMDSEGRLLYWQEKPVDDSTGKRIASVYTTATPTGVYTKFPVVSTTGGQAQYSNKEGAFYFYVDSNELRPVSSSYGQTPHVFNGSMSSFENGYYKIYQPVRSVWLTTKGAAGSRLYGTKDRFATATNEGAAIWHITKNSDGTYNFAEATEDSVNGGFIDTGKSFKLTKNAAAMTSESLKGVIRPYDVANSPQDYYTYGVLLGNNGYLINLIGVTTDFGGWENYNDKSLIYLFEQRNYTAETATGQLFWNEYAVMGTNVTEYPVMVYGSSFTATDGTNPDNGFTAVPPASSDFSSVASFGGFVPATADKTLGLVRGNLEYQARDKDNKLLYNAGETTNNTGYPVKNADGSQKRNGEGQLLWITPTTFDNGNPLMVKENIRISREPGRDESGNPNGTTNVKFYNLPDNHRIIIKYTVSATILPGTTPTYSNAAYWENHKSSENGVTNSQGKEYIVDATSRLTTHGAVKVTKYDGADTSITLPGAGFALFKAHYAEHSNTHVLHMTDDGHVSIATHHTGADHEDYPAVFYGDCEGMGFEAAHPHGEVGVVRDSGGEARGFFIPFINPSNPSQGVYTGTNGTVPLFVENNKVYYTNNLGQKVETVYYRADDNAPHLSGENNPTLPDDVRVKLHHRFEYNPKTGNLHLDADFDENGQPIVFETNNAGQQLYYQLNNNGTRVTQVGSGDRAAFHVEEGKPVPDYQTGFTDDAHRLYWVYTTEDTGDLVLNRKVLGYDVTDAAGVATYGFSDDQDHIHFNKVYCVIEAKAPEGYGLDTSRHYFVVPNDEEDGTWLNYFYHPGWPEGVHQVHMSDSGTLTYFLGVYDYRGTAKVTKLFGGNLDLLNFRPGSYSFGLYDATTVDVKGFPMDDPVDVLTVTYDADDFGWFTPAGADPAAQPAVRYKQEKDKWYRYTPPAGYDMFDTIVTGGTWTEVARPANVEYGILPGHVETLVFNNLAFDENYYIYELEHDPVLGTYIAITSGNSFRQNGSVFTATYLQEGVTVTADDPNAANRVKATLKDGELVVPMLVTTNSSYGLRMVKQFSNPSGVMEKGILGTYSFGLWKGDGSGNRVGSMLQTATLEWHFSTPEASQTILFENLEPGVEYLVYELDANGQPVENEALMEKPGNKFTVYYENGHGNHNNAVIQLDATLTNVIYVTNHVDYEPLPNTGGIGTNSFVLVGLFLMTGSLIAGFILRRKKEGRSSAS